MGFPISVVTSGQAPGGPDPSRERDILFKIFQDTLPYYGATKIQRGSDTLRFAMGLLDRPLASQMDFLAHVDDGEVRIDQAGNQLTVRVRVSYLRSTLLVVGVVSLLILFMRSLWPLLFLLVLVLRHLHAAALADDWLVTFLEQAKAPSRTAPAQSAV